ncbi:flagellar export protein FliJ [Anaerosolibacter sp.]|uniref:flagellar export protein FliJ n=1 Tax=Anaerosolibacter sp. TaxID=1872527 RepID=UPI0039EE108A
MSKFNFKYQNLLGVKEKIEELIQGKLTSAQKKLDDEEQKLYTYEKSKESYMRMIHAKMQEGTDLSVIRIWDVYIRSLEKKITYQLQVIERCNRDVDEIRKNLVKASQERKTFEKLKEIDFDDFTYVAKKEEEKFVDQLVTFKNFKSI